MVTEMISILITVGVACAVGWLIKTCITDAHKADDREPPQIPRRNVRANRSSSAERDRTQVSIGKEIPPLPRRTQHSGPRDMPASPRRVLVSGPKGLRPEQFPCCPYCKQRNYVGAEQLIFWDSGANCYRCSRGHRFKKNGMIL